jgi:hypothetical protein
MSQAKPYLFSDLARLCAIREERRHVIHTARNLLHGRGWIIVLIRERPEAGQA